MGGGHATEREEGDEVEGNHASKDRYHGGEDGGELYTEEEAKPTDDLVVGKYNLNVGLNHVEFRSCSTDGGVY